MPDSPLPENPPAPAAVHPITVRVTAPGGNLPCVWQLLTENPSAEQQETWKWLAGIPEVPWAISAHADMEAARAEFFAVIASTPLSAEETAPGVFSVTSVPVAKLAEVPEIKVDLGLSLWSVDKEYWEQGSPGTWERMRAAFAGESGPVTIRTAPKKEIRYGVATVSAARAAGRFSDVWDDDETLADTFGLPEDEAIPQGVLPRSVMDENGVDRFFDLKGGTFEEMMARVDAEEDAVVRESNAEWERLDAAFKVRAGSAAPATS